MRKLILIITGVALLSCLTLLGSRHGTPFAARVSGTSGGPSFELHVEKPLLQRPIYEVPFALFGSRDDDLWFDDMSRGARIEAVGLDRLELNGDGWHVLIEVDAEGRIAAGTRLEFPLEVGGRQRSLRCRPAEGADGYLHATKSTDSDALDGEYFAEFESCEDAETGKSMDWLFPVTVRGRFAKLSPRPRRIRRPTSRCSLPASAHAILDPHGRQLSGRGVRRRKVWHT